MKTLLAFLGGAAIGATLGVLFAPEKGEDTRKRIAAILREKGISLESDELDDLIARLHHVVKPDSTESVSVAPAETTVAATPTHPRTKK